MRKHVLDPEALSVETFRTEGGGVASFNVTGPLQPAGPANTGYTPCGDSCYRSCDGACPIGPVVD